jgi:diadenosine tetraphosphate (Ap4A) HIT family hydrolase
MAVPYVHKAYSYLLSEAEMEELWEVYRWVKDYYCEKDYFSCTRETLANRSIEHYHMHFLPGALQGKYLRKMLENQGFPIEEDLDITKKVDKL